MESADLIRLSAQHGVAQQPTVLVVSADPGCRQSILRIVGTGGLRAVALESWAAYLESDRPQIPTCLVVDVDVMSKDMLGSASKRTIAQHPPIVFVSEAGDIATCVSVMKGGAVDFLVRSFNDQALLSAVHEAVARDTEAQAERYISTRLRERYSALTRREQEVFSLVVGGLLNKQAGAALGISEITLKSHRGRVMHKMAAESFADLVRMAAKLNLPLPPMARRAGAVDTATRFN